MPLNVSQLIFQKAVDNLVSFRDYITIPRQNPIKFEGNKLFTIFIQFVNKDYINIHLHQ